MKWVEKYVASFDDISGQEKLNNRQAEEILDYVRGLIEGHLYYVDTISTTGGENTLYHVGLIGADMPSEGVPRALSLELNANELLYFESERQIEEDDFVLYQPDSGNRFLYANETQRAAALRNEGRVLQQELIGREVTGEAAMALRHETPAWVKSYHVNVGHGNCSLIVAKYGADYDLWAVDCSTYDYLIRRDYSKSLYQCLSDIARDVGVEQSNLRITRFMLTHTHFDHYNGLSYLIKQGLMDSNTLVYANLHYDCASPIWTAIKKDFLKLQCRIVEPVSGNLTMGAIRIYHPECRIYKNNSAVQAGVVNRVVPRANDASVVFGICLNGKVMVLPGDLEQKGFEKMSLEGKCIPQLHSTNYYMVSHHGSVNGHPAMPCLNPGKAAATPLDCVTNTLSKAILMGRDGAYHGTYSPVVTSYWSGKGILVKTEDAKHFVELDWGSGNVTLK